MKVLVNALKLSIFDGSVWYGVYGYIEYPPGYGTVYTDISSTPGGMVRCSGVVGEILGYERSGFRRGSGSTLGCDLLSF